MNHRLRPTRLVGAVCALALFLTAPQVRAEIQPLAPDQTAYGLTRAQWLEAFIQWFSSIPQSSSPLPQFDTAGVRAGVGQHGPVWFLPPGPLATDGSRTVTVPEGKAILVGVLFAYAAAQPGEKTDASLLQEADLSWVLDRHTRIEASLNGVSMGDVTKYRVQTSVFNLYPRDRIFGQPLATGKDPRLAAAADGIFLLYPPLPVGTHVITHEYEGIGGNGIGQDGKPFKNVGTYTLHVQKANERLP
jgi:hypothetical protein